MSGLSVSIAVLLVAPAFCLTAGPEKDTTWQLRVFAKGSELGVVDIEPDSALHKSIDKWANEGTQGRISLATFAPHFRLESPLLRVDFRGDVTVVESRRTDNDNWKQRVRKPTASDRKLKELLQTHYEQRSGKPTE
jgi:hypothetical protein